MQTVTNALMSVLLFLPALVGAIIIVVVGWVLAGFVARLVEGLLGRIGFERAARRAGVTDFIARSGTSGVTASHVLAELVKWFIRLIFLEAAAAAIHLDAVTDIINRIILFIPNLVVALLVLMVGALVARFVADMVRGSSARMGFTNPNLLASVSRFAIMAFAVIVAVNQIGIAASIVNTLFMAVVFSVALAAALAFGLGGRDTAARIWEGWYTRGRDMAPRLDSGAQTAAQRVEEPSERRMAATDMRTEPTERRRSLRPSTE